MLSHILRSNSATGLSMGNQKRTYTNIISFTFYSHEPTMRQSMPSLTLSILYTKKSMIRILKINQQNLKFDIFFQGNFGHDIVPQIAHQINGLTKAWFSRVGMTG